MLTNPKTLLLAAGLALALGGCGDDGASTRATPGAAKPYPLKTCLVTGNDLGSMGDPQTLVYQGQTVKFCCPPCIEKFNKDPQKYLAKLPK